ncbi:MAG: sensor histidine kinase, partial [Candidatus Limnocylindrales bacterium]
WTDSTGRPVADPMTDGGRGVTPIVSEGGTMAAITHDPALLEDPGLVSAVAATVRLAVDNERLNAALEAQLDEVRASRTRIVEAADAERRRLERDLHDGAQQRLVALAISLRMLGTSLGPAVSADVTEELDAAGAELRAAIEELRELARGLDPPLLREAGLGPALESLAERMRTSVKLDLQLPPPRLPKDVETTAYFFVAEALANVTKHAQATLVTITARSQDGTLALSVADDGRGGADPKAGSGLRGLADRVAAAGGTFDVTSSRDGTSLVASIPCA